VRVNSYHDLACGGLNSDVHADRSNFAHVIEEFDPCIAPDELANYLSRPVIALAVYDQ
jgi:hypothetical protein